MTFDRDMTYVKTCSRLGVPPIPPRPPRAQQCPELEPDFLFVGATDGSGG